MKFILLAVGLSAFSAFIVTPGHVDFAGTLCSTDAKFEGICINIVQGWGWPISFIIDDSKGATVGRLGIDDHYRLKLFVMNSALYYAVISALTIIK